MLRLVQQLLLLTLNEFKGSKNNYEIIFILKLYCNELMLLIFIYDVANRRRTLTEENDELY